LLPYLVSDGTDSSFDLTQAWDSPRNLPISQRTMTTFLDPSSPSTAKTNQTDFLFVTGKGTIFEAGKASPMATVTDGTSNTLVLVEVRNSGVAWAEPKDLDISQPMSLPPGNHPGGNLAAFADGSVRFMSKNVTPNLVRELATKDGGENVSPP